MPITATRVNKQTTLHNSEKTRISSPFIHAQANPQQYSRFGVPRARKKRQSDFLPRPHTHARIHTCTAVLCKSATHALERSVLFVARMNRPVYSRLRAKIFIRMCIDAVSLNPREAALSRDRRRGSFGLQFHGGRRTARFRDGFVAGTLISFLLSFFFFFSELFIRLEVFRFEIVP